MSLEYCDVCRGYHPEGGKTGGLKQRESWDCGITCLAFATEVPYEWWQKLAPDRALYPSELVRLLKVYGHPATLSPIRLEPKIEVGDFLIVQVGNRLGGHIVYLYGHDEVMDPTDGKFHSLDQYTVHWVVHPGEAVRPNAYERERDG